MKKDKKQIKNRKEHNAGRVFGKIMAGILVIFMLLSACASLIFAIL